MYAETWDRSWHHMQQPETLKSIRNFGLQKVINKVQFYYQKMQSQYYNEHPLRPLFSITIFFYHEHPLRPLFSP